MKSPLTARLLHTNTYDQKDDTVGNNVQNNI